MDKYGLIFRGITDNGKTFHVINNSGESKKVHMRVYNTYFGYPEYTTEIVFENGVQYWNYVIGCSNHRYVQFRDTKSLEIVGLFGLEGQYDFKDYDYDSYAKRIFHLVPENGKKNIISVLNEIICYETYSNEWIDIEEGDTVVDIGFNYGLFSITSKMKKPKKIIGFEPNPKLYKIFSENFKGDGIQLYNYAVSNKDSKVIFYENGDSAMSTIKEDVNKEYRQDYFEVDAISINTLINAFNLDKIDYLKVDCEGSEFDIFESFPEEYLTNNVKKIALEFHDFLHSENVQKLKSKIEKCGFKVHIKNEEGVPLGMIYAKK
jgi:FkbM family methyltransferase